ncbi:unannotated protein [freshwater metagenome]|uniref:Unannotated protein n=1 Tax=freshwater metagenome TaxID=449393 RepID=A0A6J7XV17_9ZZZZ
MLHRSRGLSSTLSVSLLLSVITVTTAAITGVVTAENANANIQGFRPPTSFANDSFLVDPQVDIVTVILKGANGGKYTSGGTGCLLVMPLAVKAGDQFTSSLGSDGVDVNKTTGASTAGGAGPYPGGAGGFGSGGSSGYSGASGGGASTLSYNGKLLAVASGGGGGAYHGGTPAASSPGNGCASGMVPANGIIPGAPGTTNGVSFGNGAQSPTLAGAAAVGSATALCPSVKGTAGAVQPTGAGGAGGSTSCSIALGGGLTNYMKGGAGGGGGYTGGGSGFSSANTNTASPSAIIAGTGGGGLSVAPPFFTNTGLPAQTSPYGTIAPLMTGPAYRVDQLFNGVAYTPQAANGKAQFWGIDLSSCGASVRPGINVCNGPSTFSSVVNVPVANNTKYIESSFGPDMVSQQGAIWGVDSVVITSGTLPPGMTISPPTNNLGFMNITGTPTTLGTYTFTIEAIKHATNNYTQTTGTIDYTKIIAASHLTVTYKVTPAPINVTTPTTTWQYGSTPPQVSFTTDMTAGDFLTSPISCTSAVKPAATGYPYAFVTATSSTRVTPPFAGGTPPSYVNFCYGPASSGLGATMSTIYGTSAANLDGVPINIFRPLSSFTVTAAPITIKIADRVKKYGETLAADQTLWGVSSGKLFGTDAFQSTSYPTPFLVNGSAASVLPGTYPIPVPLNAAIEVKPNIMNSTTNISTSYARTMVAGQIKVNPADPITVTAKDETYDFGTSAPTITFTAAGWVNSETFATSGYTAPACSPLDVNGTAFTPSASTPVGTYIIRCTSAVADNYSSIKYVDGLLTVRSTNISISTGNSSAYYGIGLPEFNPVLATGVTLDTPPACALYTGTPYDGDHLVSETPTVGTYIIHCSGPATGLSNGVTTPVEYVDASFTVTKADITLSARDVSKQYGSQVLFTGDEFDTSGTVYGLDTVTAVALTSAGSATSAAVNGSPYNINISAATGTGLENYSIHYVVGKITVTPAPNIVVTASDYKYKEGDTPVLPLIFKYTGFVGSETFSTTGHTAPTCRAESSGTEVPLNASTPTGTYDIVCSGGIASNYAGITYETGTVRVTTEITVKVSGTSKYGVGNTFTAPTLPDGELPNGEITCSAMINASASNIETSTVVGSYITSCVGPESTTTGIALVYENGLWDVTKAPLQITASSGLSKQYGDLFTFDSSHYSIVGLMNDETETVMLSSQGAPLSALASTTAYDVRVISATVGDSSSGNTTSNYSISLVTGNLLVNKAAAIAVTVLPYAYRHGTAPTLPLPFTANTFVNGETFESPGNTSPVCYAIVNPSGETVTVDANLAYGQYTLKCAGGVADNYGQITYTDSTLSVAPETVTVTAQSGSNIYGVAPTTGKTIFPVVDTPPTPTCTPVNGPTILDETSDVGNYSSHCTGPATIDVYGIQVPIEYIDGYWQIFKTQLTLSLKNVEKQYGNAYAFTSDDYTLTGVVNSDVINTAPFSAGTVVNAHVATAPYLIDAILTGSKLGNYESTTVTALLSVTKAPLVVKPKPLTLKFGTPTPVFAYTVNTFKNSETETGTAQAQNYIAPLCTSTYSAISVIGLPVEIDCNGAEADDYDITFETSTVNVNNPTVRVINTSRNLVVASGKTAIVNLTATIESPIAGCLVTFTLTPATPIFGAPAAYEFSNYTDPTYASAYGTVLVGVYFVKTTLSGNCSGPSDDTAVLTVTPPTPGTSTEDEKLWRPQVKVSGTYLAPQTGETPIKVSLEVNIKRTRDKRAGTITTIYAGKLNWEATALWRINTNVSSTLVESITGGVRSGTPSWGTSVCPAGVYTASAKKRGLYCGALMGSGYLERGTRGLSGSVTWTRVQPINYTLTVFDGGYRTDCESNVCRESHQADYAGIKISQPNGQPWLPDELPVTLPLLLRSGEEEVLCSSGL